MGSSHGHQRALLLAANGQFILAVDSLPLPPRLERAEVFGVMVPRGIRAPRGKRVRGHQAMLDTKDTGTRSRLPTTTPERTFCDLASMLTLGELVAVGDVLVRHGGLRARAKVMRAAARHPARRHRRRLLRALELLDPRAESPKESEVRVLVIESGFPTPAVNHVVVNGSGAFVARVDLAYPASKIAIEYDGDHHRDPDQWRKDQQRRRRLEALGWSVLNVTQADLVDPTGFPGGSAHRDRAAGLKGPDLPQTAGWPRGIPAICGKSPGAGVSGV